jgi:glycine/D-amino acid oxidase-like deaminating enzyme
MSARCPDVLIVGAGIVGSACALECAESGLRVTVVEEDVIGGGATAAGMGHIVVMDDSEAQFRLTHYSVCLWHTLAPSLPADCEYLPCGTLWVAADEEEMAEVVRKHDHYAARGVATHILDAQSLARAEPNLRPGLAGGLLVPGDGSVYSPAVARHLIERAQSRGARLLAGRRVEALTEGRATFADGETVDAGAVVNATGTAAPQLTPGLEIQPRKGHLLITDRYPGFVRTQLIELGYLKSAHVLKSADGVASDSVAFNVQPRLPGQLLIGSSRQFGQNDSAIDGHMLSRMLARAISYMPGLEALSGIRAWTGFRAATPDKLPLIGPVPGFERLYVASGHEGLGITTSLGTAKLLVDAILHRPSVIPPEPYAASRSVAAHA